MSNKSAVKRAREWQAWYLIGDNSKPPRRQTMSEMIEELEKLKQTAGQTFIDCLEKAEQAEKDGEG